MNTLSKLTQLPADIKDVLVGTILGDSSMRFSSYSSASFYFEQGVKHKEYLHYLFDLLSIYANSLEPNHREYVNSRTGNKGESYWFSLKSSPVYGTLAQLFYKPLSNKQGFTKIIPWAHMYELLTPRAIAFWIIDDGQYVARGGVTLCTDNYSFSDVFNLMLVLEMKFGLVCTMQTKQYSNRSKLYYRIYISKTSLSVLRLLVSKYMHSTMIYKLDN